VGGACSANWKKRNVYRLMVWKPVGMNPLVRPRCRIIDNIKINLTELALDGMDWICLAQDRYMWRALVNAVMNLLCSLNCWETTEWLYNLWLLE
jgi:hypothetical protein